MYHILIIDDDPGISSLLGEYLGARGYVVLHAADGRSGLDMLRAGGVDLVILDVMMPGMDGLSVLTALRRDSTVPVIMLTARGEETERIVGLELGADDYLAKPFNPRELLARIKAVFRRSAPGTTDVDGALCAAGIRLDVARRDVSVDGVSVALTTTEFEILRVLLAAAGRVIARERLMERARGEDWAAYERSVDVHISHLRKKLGDDPRQPQRIKTVRGVGYFVPQGE